MAQIRGTTNLAEVDITGAQRIDLMPRGVAFAASGTSGIIAAAAGAGAAFWAMRLDPSSSPRAMIERIRLEYTTLTAFTTPLTAGRRLGLFRGTSAAASGGTLLPPVQKWTPSQGSEFLNANGGDIRIATTGALTVTGITWEANALREMSLAHVGAAGAYREAIWEFHASENHPIVLEPGQLLGIRTIPAMDAAGTFQISVSMDWHEAPHAPWSN